MNKMATLSWMLHIFSEILPGIINISFGLYVKYRLTLDCVVWFWRDGTWLGDNFEDIVDQTIFVHDIFPQSSNGAKILYMPELYANATPFFSSM